MEEEIYFRASGIGALMTEGRGTCLTEKQAELLNKLQAKEKRTAIQEDDLKKLIAKRDAPPELSETAKTFIKQIWLLNKKGFYKELTTPKIEKGLLNEQDGLQLVSEVENDFYVKNEERKYKGNLTGECDVIIERDGKRIIKDIKCSWDPLTFMNGDMSLIYEYQGRAYMYLYDADEFHLHYALTDCPGHLYSGEIYKLKNRYGIIDENTPEVQPLFEQLRRNLIFSDNPAYIVEERVKTFIIERDKKKEELLLSKIEPALEYYKSLTLNGTK